MQKPVKVSWGHPLQDRLKSTQPCIQLLTSLSIECSLVIQLPLRIPFCNNQIGCRTIQGCRIAISSAKIICSTMVDVVVCINNEPAGVKPPCPPWLDCTST